MKRFQFKLERVLQLRVQTEEQCKRALGEIEQRVAAENARRSAYMDQIDKEREAIRGAESGGLLDVVRLRAGQTYVTGLRMQIGRCDERLRELAVQRQARLAEFVEARKRKRVLELVKDRSLAKWRLEFEKEEHREADDFATMGYRRKDRL